MIDRLKAIAWRLKRDVMALWFAARDPRTPLLAKVVAGFVAAYALSPIDLIPDFIPVLGLLDDLILVPAGLWLAIRLILPELMENFRAQSPRLRHRSWLGAIVIVVLWIFAATAALWWGRHLID